MIGYHITADGIYASDGTVRKEAPYLEWLLGHRPGDPKIFYDLDGSVAALAKLAGINHDEGRELHSNNKLQLDSYRLKYRPGKFFSIDKGEHEGHPYANFINAGTYAEPHYTGAEGPDDNLQKAAAAKAIGDQIISVYKDLKLDTDYITSPISAFLKKYTIPFPKTADITDDTPAEIKAAYQQIFDLAYATVKGNHLEAWQRGYFPNAFDWDIHGAYPAELARLLDIRRGRWIHEKRAPAEAVYGFGQGELTTWREFHPFLYRDDNNRNINVSITPVGTRPDKLPLDKIRLLKDYGMGKWAPYDGWWWVPEGPQNELFKGAVNFLWNKRPAAGVGKEIIKTTLSGLWGKMLETYISESGKMKLGDNYSPIYGSVVENAVQVKVTKACLDNDIVPLQIAVDGIISHKQLKLDIGPNLGQWRLSHQGQCIIVSAGQVAFEGKPAAEEFSLTFDFLYNEIKKHPKRKEYVMAKFAPVTLARALNLGWDQLGIIDQVKRVINIKEDSKRMWMDDPKNGGDLLSRTFTSAPWECSMLNIGG